MKSEETLRPRRPRFRAASGPRSAVALVVAGLAVSACAADSPPAEDGSPAEPASAAAGDSALVDVLQERTFRYFWDLSHPVTGLTPDRAPTRSFASIAATGFALTAYPVGVERGWVPREEAARRTLATLEFLWNAPQDSVAAGVAGHRGFFYHFLDPETGHRFETVELSTVDTALFIAGALFCRGYYDGDSPEETAIRAHADSLYRRIEWDWASPRPPAVGHGWNPESGFIPYDWRGYNEAMILYLLALGSPTHPVEPAAWDAWTSAYRWGTFHGQEHVGFAPLFGHQYTHVWVDFRGIRDQALGRHGIDYFENSRRAVLAQRAYALENPGGWTGYGPDLWGLTACDGPVDLTVEIEGRTREFRTYAARGASFTGINDDGTVCPSAAAASIAFAPEVVVPVLEAMRRDWGEHLFGRYGFLDALNPTFRLDVPVQHGHVVPGVGWFDSDWLGIDQGPIVAMIENHRTGLVWRTMRRDGNLLRGLRSAGFSGGWLDSVEAGP